MSQVKNDPKNSLNVISNDPAYWDLKRYIKAGESHVNRDENQYFLISNNLKFIVMRTQFYNLYNPISKYKNNFYLLDNIW